MHLSPNSCTICCVCKIRLRHKNDQNVTLTLVLLKILLFVRVKSHNHEYLRAPLQIVDALAALCHRLFFKGSISVYDI